MKESTSKERVLKAIRDAQVEAERQQKVVDVDMKTPLYPPFEKELDESFAQAVADAGGIFVYCENQLEVIYQLQNMMEEYHYDTLFTNDPEIEDFLSEGGVPFVNYEKGIQKAQASITLCECMIARTGTVVMSSALTSGRRTHTLPKAHCVLAFRDQLVREFPDAYSFLRRKYKGNMPSMISYITGPSRTDTIEGEFVYGANGPGRLFVFYIDI